MARLGKCAGGLEIDDEFVGGRLRDRQSGRTLTKKLIQEIAGLPAPQLAVVE